MFNERIKGHHQARLKQKKKHDFISEDKMKDVLSKSPEKKEGIVYFHVPYCDKICSFCSMNRSKLDGELEEYTNYLINEIQRYASFKYIQEKSFESIYFGGGTPTILKLRQLEKIINAINKNFNLSKTCEFSFESTLHNLSLEKIKLMQNMGVNRYSIGIQTFSNKGRKLLNRTNKQEEIVAKLSKIKDIFQGNLCIDIIYNYPEETLEEVLEDAKLTKFVQADSVSFYSLMFHEGSVLFDNISQDYYNIKTDKLLHDSFLRSMLQSDYEILEHTKLNKINKDEYKYIKLSHKGVDLLPIGIGAGGKIAGYSSFSPKKGVRFFTKINEDEQKLKRLSALFQYPKINLKELQTYVSTKCYHEILNFLKVVQQQGYITLDETHIIFEIEGIFWGNTIAKKVLDIAIKEYE